MKYVFRGLFSSFSGSRMRQNLKFSPSNFWFRISSTGSDSSFSFALSLCAVRSTGTLYLGHSLPLRTAAVADYIMRSKRVNSDRLLPFRPCEPPRPVARPGFPFNLRKEPCLQSFGDCLPSMLECSKRNNNVEHPFEDPFWFSKHGHVLTQRCKIQRKRGNSFSLIQRVVSTFDEQFTLRNERLIFKVHLCFVTLPFYGCEGRYVIIPLKLHFVP